MKNTPQPSEAKKTTLEYRITAVTRKDNTCVIFFGNNGRLAIEEASSCGAKNGCRLYTPLSPSETLCAFGNNKCYLLPAGTCDYTELSWKMHNFSEPAAQTIDKTAFTTPEENALTLAWKNAFAHLNTENYSVRSLSTLTLPWTYPAVTMGFLFLEIAHALIARIELHHNTNLVRRIADYTTNVVCKYPQVVFAAIKEVYRPSEQRIRIGEKIDGNYTPASLQVSTIEESETFGSGILGITLSTPEGASATLDAMGKIQLKRLERPQFIEEPGYSGLKYLNGCEAEVQQIRELSPIVAEQRNFHTAFKKYVTEKITRIIKEIPSGAEGTWDLNTE